MLRETVRFVFTEYLPVLHVFGWYFGIIFLYCGVYCYSANKVLIVVYRAWCIYCAG